MDNKANSLEIVLLTHVLLISYRIKTGICPDFQLVSAYHAVIFVVVVVVNVGLKVNFFSADNKTEQKLIEEKMFPKIQFKVMHMY